jgi:hypothetical protein
MARVRKRHDPRGAWFEATAAAFREGVLLVIA